MFADSRFRCLVFATGLFFTVNLALRLVLAWDLASTPGIGADLPIATILAAGLWNDLPALFWLLVPLAALLFLPPWRGKAVQWVSAISFACVTAFFLFTSTGEYFFWDEFSARFNFVAVDYLIYTTEVLANIRESYPVLPLLTAMAALSAGAAGCFLRVLSPAPRPMRLLLRQRALVVSCLLLLALGGSQFMPTLSADARPAVADLGHNGLATLFAAYKHNQLDYKRFYAAMDEDEALARLRVELAEPGVRFERRNEPLLRQVRHDGPEKRLNVVQIVVESLGSAALGEYTPEILRLREQSLSFSNMRATGTRTVRGIEALTLSLPPTPGASIVRRPGNEGLFSIGSLFASRGYDTTFVYGGYGYFDNMNAFFAGNGFRLVDRARMKNEPTFANAWGVCDEDLYTAALAEADASHAAGRPFYQFVLTTSNHRPFTYPGGRVSLPSGSSRRGAVAYTDYAIGRFIREASQKPWFANTVFVIVADHTAGSAGTTALPPENYVIPCLVYSPAHIKPAQVDTLSSQIDVAPTLFALLGWSYDSAFFGKNILTMEKGRAYIGTYQLLGRLEDDRLVVLEPLKAPRLESPATVQSPDADRETQLTKAAIAPYQTVQNLFTSGRLRETATHIREAALHRTDVSLNEGQKKD